MREDMVEESRELLEVKLVIDDQEVTLVPNGESKNFAKFKEPEAVKGEIIASIYVKLGWKPKKS